MRGSRWLILAAGAAALVVLFFVFRPGDGGGGTSRPTPSPSSTVTSDPTPTETPAETPEPTPTATGTLDAVEIEVEDGRVQGPSRIRVTLGQRVAIEVKADVSDHVHVHGYDILRDVAPDQDVIVRFRADIPGVFEIELEDAGQLLTMLEVTP